MATFKVTGSWGGNDIADIVISAGSAEAQSETVSINVDHTNIGKAELLQLIGKMVDRIYAADFPPL